MLKKLLIITLGLLLIPFVTNIHSGKVVAENNPRYIADQEVKVVAKSVDPRALVLKDYLAKYNSPLQDNAQDFVDAADLYGIDWKLVPAISGVESTFGKVTPGGCNAWGWGIYGDNRFYFPSCKNAIYTISKGLKEDYISRGLLTPYQLNTRYASSPTWGTHVAYFLNDINRFSQGYPITNPDTILDDIRANSETHSSAQLSLNIN